MTELLALLEPLQKSPLQNLELKDLLDSLIPVFKETLQDPAKNEFKIFRFIKLYWFIESFFLNQEFIDHPARQSSIPNYNWVLDEQLLSFLEEVQARKSISVHNPSFQILPQKMKDLLISLELIGIINSEITLTNLSMLLLKSYTVSDLYHHFSGEFEEDILPD